MLIPESVRDGRVYTNNMPKLTPQDKRILDRAVGKVVSGVDATQDQVPADLAVALGKLMEANKILMAGMDGLKKENQDLRAMIEANKKPVQVLAGHEPPPPPPPKRNKTTAHPPSIPGYEPGVVGGVEVPAPEK